MTQILQRLKLNNVVGIKVPGRCKHGPDHWSVLKKKVSPKDKALDHFNDLYQSIYGGMWPNIRSAMLQAEHKYIALVNNFGDTASIAEKLQLLGAVNLRDLYVVHQQNKIDRDQRKIDAGIPIDTEDDTDEISDTSNSSNVLEAKLETKSMHEIQSLFPSDYIPSKELLRPKTDIELEDEELDPKPVLDPTVARSLEEDLKDAVFDEHRIIQPSKGLSLSALHEFVPTTKIRGLDDYVLESEHYNYFTAGADFEIKVEKEKQLNFPKYLQVFTYLPGNNSTFPSPRRQLNEIFDYYLMDGASILPVLALDLKLGDRVLDMCAAPGGKSLVALQTLLPQLFVANDDKLSRFNRMNKVFEDYLGDLHDWTGKLFLTNIDGREIEDKEVYNKILVDVPCTTDRLQLHEDDNNWFKPGRTKERLRLPEVQVQILTQALKLIVPGGTVVYSTCTLSPVQNEGIVQLALKRLSQESQAEMVIKDMDIALAPLRFLFKFGRRFGFRYGHIVLPSRQYNWGPLYFCKIVRVR